MPVATQPATTPAKPKARKAPKAKPTPARKNASAKAMDAVSAKHAKRKAKAAVRKDAPRTGDMTGSVLAAYKRVLAATPKAKADAMNANAIAKKLSEEAGKTVWPVPTKKHLETGVHRGEVVKVTTNGRTAYYVK